MISLSPFFNIVLIIENFSLSGKTPKERDLLQIHVEGEIIKGALIFRILKRSTWLPQEFLVFRDFIMVLLHQLRYKTIGYLGMDA